MEYPTKCLKIEMELLAGDIHEPCFSLHANRVRNSLLGDSIVCLLTTVFYPKWINDICIGCNILNSPHNRFLSILFLENSLDKQVKKFQLSLYHHPDEMKSFILTHCPSLWENRLSAITNDRAPLTSDRADLQQKRMVALLHILAYFRYDTYFMKWSDKHTSCFL